MTPPGISHRSLWEGRELDFTGESGEKATEAALADVACFSKTRALRGASYLAPGLWLRPVATHDVLEGLVLFGDLGKNRSIL